MIIRDVKNRYPEWSRTWMLVVGAGVLVGVMGMPGCGAEEAPPVVVAPPPPPPKPVAPPKPAVTPVTQLMDDLSIDDRVVLMEDQAPPSTEDRVAVLEFFDAFVRGDANSLAPMMTPTDRTELEALAASDAWATTVGAIEEVMVDTGAGAGPAGENCALALFDVDGKYQPQLWYYSASPDGYEFEAVSTPPNVMDQLYGDDWIARWHEMLQQQNEQANALDIELQRERMILDDEAEEEEKKNNDSPGGGGGGGGAGPGGPSPGGPSGGRRGRRPRNPKRLPPGAPHDP